MTLSEELTWRGFVNQTTLQDAKVLDGSPITFYWGVDPSASSMTIGNLAAAMMVRHFIDHGHHAILLVGGATGMIGDPDGKNERNLLSDKDIESNKVAISAQYKKVFAGEKFEIVDNYEWFKKINYLEFLRTVGKHVPMRVMLGREFIQSRLGEGGSGISYAEFSYSLIQGYDFLHLYKTKKVTLQLCGADQWGNSIAGVDLIRRVEGGEAHVYSSPLIVNKTTGVKFGKTEDGAIWLDPNLTSVFKFYQFWLNVDDHSVSDYLRIFTLISKPEYEKIMVEFEHDRGARLAQKTLAYEVTKLVHGEEASKSALAATEVLFGKGDFANLAVADKELLKTELPVVNVQGDIIDTFVAAGLASSKSEAIRFLDAGALSINGHVLKANTGEEMSHGLHLLKRGKNSFAILEIS